MNMQEKQLNDIALLSFTVGFNDTCNSCSGDANEEVKAKRLTKGRQTVKYFYFYAFDMVENGSIRTFNITFLFHIIENGSIGSSGVSRSPSTKCLKIKVVLGKIAFLLNKKSFV